MSVPEWVALEVSHPQARIEPGRAESRSSLPNAAVISVDTKRMKTGFSEHSGVTAVPHRQVQSAGLRAKDRLQTR